MTTTKTKSKYLILIGNNIRKLRTETTGYSQEDLAFLSGLHRTYISAVERGENNISILNLLKIAKVLKVKIAILSDGIDK